jgi:hypothetical protein
VIKTSSQKRCAPFSERREYNTESGWKVWFFEGSLEITVIKTFVHGFTFGTMSRIARVFFGFFREICVIRVQNI